MIRPALCTLATIAVLISGYLLWITLSGQAGPQGCGAAAGCGQVLSGRWSHWLGVPVSAPALGIYLVLLGAAWLNAPRRPAGQQRLAWRVLAGGSALAVGAGAWFLVLQVMEGRYCRYCLAVHACGLIIAALVWLNLPTRRDPGPVRLGLRSIIGCIVAAIGGMALLIWGQAISPPAPAVAQLTVLPGFAVEELPTTGRREAQFRIVVLADYTCEHCRYTHRMLDSLRRRLSDEVAITIAPMPLDAGCNPIVLTTEPRHRNGCVLARLALAVWRADPAKYPEMESWLFADAEPADPVEARQRAEGLVGAAALAKAEQDPWIARTLQHTTDLYRRLGGGVVPKVLIGGTRIDGEPQSAEALLETIRHEWGDSAIRPGA